MISISIAVFIAGIMLSISVVLVIAYLDILRSHKSTLFDLEKLKQQLVTTENAKRRQSVKYGNTTEQVAPWMNHWPFPGKINDFRLLGKPIDGVQFTDEAIFFVEMKAGSSTLSPKQRAIRQLVRDGRVGWCEFYINENKPTKIECPWIPENPSRFDIGDSNENSN